MMSISQAAKLVLESLFHLVGGEIFITKMPVITIGELARSVYSILRERGELVDDFSAERHIELIGSRPGEKLYEELMTDEERIRSRDIGDFFVVLPVTPSVIEDQDVRNEFGSYPVPTRTYNSHHEKNLEFNDVKKFLLNIDAECSLF